MEFNVHIFVSGFYPSRDVTERQIKLNSNFLNNFGRDALLPLVERGRLFQPEKPGAEHGDHAEHDEGDDPEPVPLADWHIFDVLGLLINTNSVPYTGITEIPYITVPSENSALNPPLPALHHWTSTEQSSSFLHAVTLTRLPPCSVLTWNDGCMP